MRQSVAALHARLATRGLVASGNPRAIPVPAGSWPLQTAATK